MMEILGYFTESYDFTTGRELNAKDVFVAIAKIDDDTVLIFEPAEDAHFQMDSFLLGMFKPISKEMYLQVSEGYYTYSEYL